jgi:hypothetical protein
MKFLVHSPPRLVDTIPKSLPDFVLLNQFPITINLESPNFPMKNSQSQPEESFENALALFQLSLPLESKTLHHRYQELLVTWHPHRYANMTNNPTKYMQMYKKGEAMTKEIRSAFALLKESLEQDFPPSSD